MAETNGHLHCDAPVARTFSPPPPHLILPVDPEPKYHPDPSRIAGAKHWFQGGHGRRRKLSPKAKIVVLRLATSRFLALYRRRLAVP